MIDAKEAIKKCIEYLREIHTATGESAVELRVEEVERAEGDEWLITISYTQYLGTMGEFIRGGEAERVYKKFHVNGNTGNVESMTIRQVHAPS